MAGIQVELPSKRIKKVTSFPCIGVLDGGIKDTQLIVLFTEYGIGTVLKADTYKVGYYSTTWSTDELILYDGIIKISNK